MIKEQIVVLTAHRGYSNGSPSWLYISITSWTYWKPLCSCQTHWMMGKGSRHQPFQVSASDSNMQPRKCPTALDLGIHTNELPFLRLFDTLLWPCPVPHLPWLLQAKGKDSNLQLPCLFSFIVYNSVCYRGGEERKLITTGMNNKHWQQVYFWQRLSGA